MSDVPTLRDLAKLVRSKNAGPFELTFDVMFEDPARYALVKNSGAVTREALARAFAIEPDAITNFQFFDPALAFKLTIHRPRAQGSIGETDTFGAQQHVPLLNFEISTASCVCRADPKSETAESANSITCD